MRKEFLAPLLGILFLLPLTSCKTLGSFYHALQGGDLIKISALGEGELDFKDLDKVKLKGFSISDYHHPLVRKHLNQYILYGKPTLKNILKRGEAYLPIIRTIFTKHGIPLDLVYLPIIESGFNPFAHSHAGAKGLWQFIYNTGILYRLKGNYWHDDRQDVYRSTEAAAYHLKYLYKKLGDWLLVLAAYNAGLGKISTAIKRYKTRNYWELIKYDYIKPETKNYVPKFIAASIIAKNSKKYQIDFPKKPFPELVSFEVEDATELKLLAKAANLKLSEFKKYNTSLRRWATPPSKKYPIYLPASRFAIFKENFAKIPLDQRVTFRRYFVKIGDNLTKIANKFNIPINPIAEINQFKSLNDIYAGRNIVIPIRGLAKAKSHDQAAKEKPVAVKKSESEFYTFVYIVDEKDTLYDIALKFKVKLKHLMEWNGLKSYLSLRKNQTLIIKKAL